MFYGRVAAASPAFKSCSDYRVAQRVGSSRYEPCSDGGLYEDPLFGATPQEQKLLVLGKTLSPNTMLQFCTGAGDDEAQSFLGSPSATEEAITWGNSFKVHVAATTPEHFTGKMTFGAMVIWHECEFRPRRTLVRSLL